MANRGDIWSKIALILSMGLLFIAGFIYYPKHNNLRTEATLSWDVSGYYMYLPAIFIYQDIKEQKFLDDIIEKYQPTPSNIQSFEHSSGNYVMKYSIGQAVTLSPFFAVGHLWASIDARYTPDGFSYPYQLCVAIGCFLIAFLGLFYLRKVLLIYFSDKIVAITLLSIVFGSNYLEYAGISSGMSHNALFTYYALLLWHTVQFHKTPTKSRAIIIGALIGIMALTRPTEIISFLIPIMWGVKGLGDLLSRLKYLLDHKGKLIPAIVTVAAIGCIQLGYWKYASGDWIVYSYGEEGFSWLSPHVVDCMFSYRSGWLTYSPMMIFSMIGLVVLWFKNRLIFRSIIPFTILFMYLCFAWDVWWYGGAIGQRAMVQSYPILAFAMCGFYQWISNQKQIYTWPVGCCFILFIYLNLYWVHQSHKGGQLYVGQMTKEYFWKVVGRFDPQVENLKLLDTNYNFDRNVERESKVISVPDSIDFPIIIDRENQFSELIKVSDNPIGNQWIRLLVDVETPEKQWDLWKMAQVVCKFTLNENTVKYESIRIHRVMEHGDRKIIHMDVKVPRTRYDMMEVYFWNAGSQKKVIIHDLTIENYQLR